MNIHLSVHIHMCVISPEDVLNFVDQTISLEDKTVLFLINFMFSNIASCRKMLAALKVTKISSVISLLCMSMYKSVCMFVVDIKIPMHLSSVSTQTLHI